MVSQPRNAAAPPRVSAGGVLVAVAAAAVVVFPAVALVAVATYALLRLRWPDRLVALLLAAVGAVAVVTAVMWTDYPGRWLNVAHGFLGGSPASLTDWLVLMGWGVIAGPPAGALYWRVMQRRRERSPYSGEDERERRERAEERRRRAVTQKAQALSCGNGKLAAVARPLSVPVGDPAGPFLGRFQRGDLPAEWRAGALRGVVRVPLTSGKARHVVIIGATGLGKTETTLGICEWAAVQGWQVIYLSGKEPPALDQSAAPRLAAVADQLGLKFKKLVSDNSPFDPMRGNADDIRDRLVRIEEWGDRYWAHCANLLVGLALELAELNGKRLETLPDLVFSLLRDKLAKMSEKDERVSELLRALKDDATSGALTRYASLAMHLRSWVGPTAAGGWAWEDADVICAELPTGSRPEAGAALLRLMVRDFEAYLRDETRRQFRNGQRRPVLLVVEEAGAVAGDPVIGKQFVDLVERARSAGAYVTLTAQDPLGLGDERAVSAILTNAAVVTYRQTTQAEAVASLAGTRRTDEGSAAFDTAGSVTTEGSTRRQHAFKLSPQILRELGAGECVVVSGGKFALVAATMSRLGYAIPDTPQVREARQLVAIDKPEIAAPEPTPVANLRPEWR